MNVCVVYNPWIVWIIGELCVMLRIQNFVFNAFQENTYVIHHASGEGLLIDPGCYGEEEKKQLQEWIASHHIRIVGIVNTHCHIDHVLGNAWAKRRFNAPLYIPEGEKPYLQAVAVYASNYGFHAYEAAEEDGYLGTSLALGDEEMEILRVPGHSADHRVLVHRATKSCLCGDVLFKGSMGRTDLPGGNHALLLEQIRTKMYTLPDDMVLYPGHGPTTTIGYEKRYNPFVKADRIQ